LTLLKCKCNIAKKQENKKGEKAMENMIIAKQVIDFHRSTFDGAFNSLNVLQQQMKELFQTFIQQSPWFPPESKTAFNEWEDICDEGRSAFKKAIDNNYKKAEEYFDACESVAKTDRTKTSKTK
jgi:hypothetical protein